MCPVNIGEICRCEQERKKAEQTKRSVNKNKIKHKLGKPPPERHLLKDDPKYLELVEMSKAFRLF